MSRGRTRPSLRVIPGRARATLPVVDLDEVRWATLLRAVESLHTWAYRQTVLPSSIDAYASREWRLAFSEVEVWTRRLLTRSLARQGACRERFGTLRDELAIVAAECRRVADTSVGRIRTLAYDTAAETLALVVEHAARSPTWLRQWDSAARR